MYPHRIRLRGPWEIEVPDGSPRTVRFPIRWAELDEQAIARRSFEAPSRLDAHERVWLVGEGLAGVVEAILNERRLGKFGEQAALLDQEGRTVGVFRNDTIGKDVTSILAPRNLLELRLGPRTRETAEPIDIAVEIRASAWLESLRLVRDAEGCAIEGRVVGESSEPLEIHAIADRHGCGDLTTTASHMGTPFRMRLDRQVDAVRVEMIHVSTVWWAEDVQSPEAQG